MKTSTLLLIAGAGVALYLITRPKPTGLPPGYPYPTGFAPPPQANPTIALAGDATSVLNNLFNNIF